MPACTSFFVCYPLIRVKPVFPDRALQAVAKAENRDAIKILSLLE